MPLSYIYDFAFRTLIVFLPFATFFGVFFSQVLHIPGVSFLKEICLFVMLVVLFVLHVRGRLQMIWTRYDILIGAYILLFSLITIFTTGIEGLIYGGRYDFAFLVCFFVVFHGFSLLEKPVSYYLRLFLIAGGVALFLSTLLKWPLSEDILLYFGYSGNPSNWQFGSAVPIFHGVEDANVRRFQGIFDGPNTMGAFLLMYIGVAIYYFRTYKEWFFVLGLGVVFGIILVNYTYSRSAQLGYIGAFLFILAFSFSYIYRHYKNQFIALLIVAIFGVGAVFIQYGSNLQAIIERSGSSKGHAERMIIGVDRALEYPLGQGLASAGPAYRHVLDLAGKERSEIEKIDVQYIPESWYIQQFIEGGIVGGILFILLMFIFFLGLYRYHIILAAMFLSILIMNFFLHTFESSLISLSLFSIIGIVLGSRNSTHIYGKR